MRDKRPRMDGGDLEGDGRIVVGVVCTRREIRLVAAANSRAALDQILAEYVASMADAQLYPPQSTRLRELLRSGAHAAAVELYFTSAEKRWDEEWLAVRIVTPVARSGGMLGWRSMNDSPRGV